MSDIAGYSRRSLHTRAAAYYRGQRLPREEWSNLQSLEPALLEYEHLVKAGAYDDAFDVIEELDFFYLNRLGYAQRTHAMRSALLDKVSDIRKNTVNLIGIGRAGITLGESKEAAQYLARAVELARTHALKLEEGIALANLAQALFDLGNNEQSIETYTQSITIARKEPRDRRGEAARLNGLAVVYREQGELQLALDCLNEGIDVLKPQLPDGRSVFGSLLKNIGDIQRLLGDYSSAESCLQQALVISLEDIRRSKRAQHEALSGLASISEDLGDFEAANKYIREALDIAIEIGERDTEGYKKRDLGRILLGLGNDVDGLKHLTESLEIATSLNVPRLMHYAAYDLALAYLVKGNIETATAYIRQAEEFIMPRNRPSVLSLAGVVSARLGDYAKASSSFDLAISSAEDLCKKANSYYEGLYARAIAFSGKALVQREYISNLTSEAQLVYYEDALAHCQAAGVLRRVLSLLEALAPIDDLGILSRPAVMVSSSIK